MQLGDILDDLTLDVATGSLEITHVDIARVSAYRARSFSRCPASSTNGARFASDAVGRGALCVIASAP